MNGTIIHQLILGDPSSWLRAARFLVYQKTPPWTPGFSGRTSINLQVCRNDPLPLEVLSTCISCHVWTLITATWMLPGSPEDAVSSLYLITTKGRWCVDSPSSLRFSSVHSSPTSMPKPFKAASAFSSTIPTLPSFTNLQVTQPL